MATYTDNYQLTKPTYAEQADIGVINSNMNIIDDIMHSSQVSLAPAYDSTQTYAEGDVVMYELLMYKCISPTTGVWDGSKWERTTASESGGGGSAELDILGEASGAVASFADGASAGLAKCIADINPVQDLHGYSKPWAGGAGKNKFNIDENRIGIDYDNSSSLSRFWQTVSLPNGNYTISFNGNMTGISEISFGKADSTLPFSSINQHAVRTVMSSSKTSLTVTIDASYPFAFIGVIKSGGSITKADIDNLQIQIETGNTATAYEPYANICPISGHSSITINVSPTNDPAQGVDTTIQLGDTYYGGTLNVVTGELVIDRAIITLDGSESWNDNSTINGFTLYNKLYVTSSRAEGISDRFKIITEYGSTEIGLILGFANKHIYASHITDNLSGISSVSDWKTWLSNNNVNIVCEITPQTIQLTPQEVNSLLGQNNISADTGDIDIVYVKASAPIQPNPTGTPTATLKKLGIEGAVFEVPSGGGGSSSGINYSTTEQVIGTWIDGKPLYQKTFDLTAVQLTDNTWNANILGTIGIRIKHFEGLFSIGQTEPSMRYDYYRSSSEYFTTMLVNDSSDINVRPNMNTGTLYAGIVTIQYTKITD